MKKRLLAIAMTLAMTLSLLPASALAAEPKLADGAPTASGTNFFANGTPITITATKPEGEETTISGLTTGTNAYISWNDNGTTKYVGVGSNTSVYGGADGSSSAVSVTSTSIDMTGGTVKNILGGNFGQTNATKEGCSAVTSNVNISVTGGKVTNLIYGGGENNTCVNGTVTITLNNVKLGESCYVNGGVLGHGKEGVRNIEEGTMTTHAVVNKVVIDATGSEAYVFGGGGSGSTKVVEAVVTLNKCTVDYLYASGINGEMEKSSLKAIDCEITGELAATNRGFIETADVTLEDCNVKLLMTGATTGCFETDSGKPDGSGITGSVLWTIDDLTEVEAARLTPLAKRDANDRTTATLDNITVEKSGAPLNISVAEFKPHSKASVNTFLVSETGKLTLKNVQATVADGQTLTNVGTIDMDEASKLSVASGATFEQVGTVNGGKVVAEDGGTINDDYVARIGTIGYEKLQDAVNAVTTSDPTTITLLKDTAGAGVVVNDTAERNLTFDLGGHTYTITSGVGSSGTETNGFQLIKDNNITFKNGTIAAAPADGKQVKILIQNYSNLTLDKVTLDGTKLVASAPYTLSNNFGETVIKDSEIIAANNGYAFDVYYWPSNGYGDGVSVTVEGDSVITGKIEYGGDNTTGSTNVAEYASLNIEGGTFTGELRLGQIGTSSKAGINITGGTFKKADGSAWDVSAYVQPGMEQDENGKIVIDTDTAVAEINGVGYTSLDAALEAAKAMIGDVTITLIADADLTTDFKAAQSNNISYDLSASSLTSLTIRGANQDVKIISGVDGNNIDGPVYCPKINVTLPAKAAFTVENLTFPNDLQFDSNGGTVVIQNCVFNGSISGYPQAKSISYRNNTFEFKGTADNFYSGNAYPVWYKLENEKDFVFTGNTVKGYRGVHIETRGQADIQVDNNRFELDDSKYANKAIALQLVGKLNGEISFQDNYVDAYMAICFYSGLAVEDDASLTVKNNYLVDDCKLYGSNEWSSNEETADAFAKTIIDKLTGEGGSSTVTPGHTDHNYVDGVCTICGQSEPTSSTAYAITVENSNNGTVTASRTRANKGLTVTLTVKADEGYALDTLTVTDKNGNEIKLTDKGDGKYTFTMPRSKVTVEAAFSEIVEEPETLPFADVPTGAYYYDAVAWAVENGVTGGTSATTFSPDNACTRAQMMTFLWRAAGSPEPETTVNPFTDVSAGDYYYKAVLWAAEQGITGGTSATTFSPDATVTRGQTVTFLWRNAGSPAASGSSFADVAADAYYAPAVAWAAREGITGGTSATTFSPDNACTRAQIMTFLWRDML